MPRQLNVRSDRAYGTARRLASRLGMSTTAVVETALERFDQATFAVPTFNDLEPEQKAFADMLLDLARQGRDEGDRSLTSDHTRLYDDIGAPE